MTPGSRSLPLALVVLAASILVAPQPASALGVLPPPGSPGRVRFVKIANSRFDRFTQNPTSATQDWMRAKFWRLVGYSPYFDSRLSWFPNAWVYKDLYAIYTDSALATDHPEWILRDAAGTKLFIPYDCAGGSCPQYAADVGNPAFRARWIADAKATLAAGYKGLYVDDVNLLLSRVGNGQGKPAVPVDPRTHAPMTEPDWRRYMAEFCEQIRGAFAGTEIVHNVIWYVPKDDPAAVRELESATFLNLERGVNDAGIRGGGGTYGFDSFLALVDWAHARGKGVVFDASAATDAEREYGLAAYFLVNNGRDGIGNDPGGSPDDWWPGYDVVLGSASGARYTWQGVIRRDFSQGVVLVNEPGAPTTTLTIDGPYADVRGTPRNTVTLGPAAGAVLVRRAGQS